MPDRRKIQTIKNEHGYFICLEDVIAWYEKQPPTKYRGIALSLFKQMLLIVQEAILGKDL